MAIGVLIMMRLQVSIELDRASRRE